MFHRPQFVSLPQKKFPPTSIQHFCWGRKSEVLKCKCATLLVSCVRWIGKSAPSTESPLQLQHCLWTHYQSEGCQVQHGQTGGEEFRERSMPPLAEPLGSRRRQSSNGFSRYFHANSHWNMWRPTERKRNDSENMREREERWKTGERAYFPMHGTLQLKPHRLFSKRMECS